MSNQSSDPTSRGAAPDGGATPDEPVTPDEDATPDEPVTPDEDATPDGPGTEPSAEPSTGAPAQSIAEPTAPDVPRALAELDLTTLIGRTLTQARAEVQGRGGMVRAVEPGGVITLDYRPNRVTLTVTDDRVSAVTGIG